jgi:hypothetical protein
MCEHLFHIPGYLWGMTAIGVSMIFKTVANYLAMGKQGAKA